MIVLRVIGGFVCVVLGYLSLSGEVLNHHFNDDGTLILQLLETDATWKGIWGVGDGMLRIENVKLGGGGLFYGEISCDGSGYCEGFIQPWPVHMR